MSIINNSKIDNLIITFGNLKKDNDDIKLILELQKIYKLPNISSIGSSFIKISKDNKIVWEGWIPLKINKSLIIEKNDREYIVKYKNNIIPQLEIRRSIFSYLFNLKNIVLIIIIIIIILLISIYFFKFRNKK
jgi:hypothetical protein